MSERIQTGYLDWYWEGTCLYGSTTGSSRMYKSPLVRLHYNTRSGWMAGFEKRIMSTQNFTALSRLVLARLVELREAPLGSIPA